MRGLLDLLAQHREEVKPPFWTGKKAKLLEMTLNPTLSNHWRSRAASVTLLTSFPCKEISHRFGSGFSLVEHRVDLLMNRGVQTCLFNHLHR